jgi:hypothetical protein
MNRGVRVRLVPVHGVCCDFHGTWFARCLPVALGGGNAHGYWDPEATQGLLVACRGVVSGRQKDEMAGATLTRPPARHRRSSSHAR